jgi:hypothetical protein
VKKHGGRNFLDGREKFGERKNCEKKRKGKENLKKT